MTLGRTDLNASPRGNESPAGPGDPIRPPLARARRLILAALSLGFVFLADWLFWNHPRGWTIGGFGLLLAGSLLAWERPLPRGKPALGVLVAVSLLCLHCLEEPNILTVVMGVLGLLTLALIAREGWSSNAVVWAQRWTLAALTAWQSPFQDAAAWHRQRRNEDGPTLCWLRRWSLPVLLCAVFVALFAVANPVVSNWLHDVGTGLRDLVRELLEVSPSGWRLLMWALVGVSVWGLLRFRSGLVTPADGTPADSGPVPAKTPSPALLIRCLVLFNLAFAVQSVLDLYYLWGGGSLPEGLTHAQYVHRGAYPLLAAAILAALFVLAAFRAGPRNASLRLARGLVYLWLIQNLLLVMSAAWRLRLYVEVYTLTRWRVAAALWMLLVLCGLVWILLRIVTGRSNLWLTNANTVTALLVLYGSVFVNYDGLIAGFNVAHCQEVRGVGPTIDLVYLERLGPDTLPALLRLAGKLKEPSAKPALRDTIERLRADLQADLGSWRGWTWRRHRLRQLAFPVVSENSSARGRLSDQDSSVPSRPVRKTRPDFG